MGDDRIRSAWIDERVVAVVSVQVAGYATLLAMSSHGDPSPVIEAVRTVPLWLLAPFAAVLGAVLSAVGRRRSRCPRSCLGDVLVFVSAYAVGVAAVATSRRTKAGGSEGMPSR